MKFSTLLLLPLAVSAAVVRPRHEGTATIKQITPGEYMSAAERKMAEEASCTDRPIS